MDASFFLPMTDVELDQRCVLIREDFNVPLEQGRVVSDERLRRAIPSIRLALEAGAAVILVSHLGRPKETQFDPAMSLEPVAAVLAKLLAHPVRFHAGDAESWTALRASIKPGDVVLLENIRFMQGENDNALSLAKRLAGLCDVFVMDAFASAHRAQASTEAVIHHAPVACAGPLLIEELSALRAAFDDPARPLVAVVGGSKVSTKIHVLQSLIHKVNVLIVGGGIANTFLKAAGYPVGKSLIENDWVAAAKNMLSEAKRLGVEIPLPEDVVVATEFSPTAKAEIKLVTDVAADDMILDVGPLTRATYPDLFACAQTIVWNGPVGVFEFDAFAAGTKALAAAITGSAAFSLAGGGDTISALEKFQLADRISYISTGGGAFLEYLEGRALPALEALKARFKN
jgi:phosphoglycerate kinase